MKYKIEKIKSAACKLSAAEKREIAGLIESAVDRAVNFDFRRECSIRGAHERDLTARDSAILEILTGKKIPL